jgi:hypothetical protein
VRSGGTASGWRAAIILSESAARRGRVRSVQARSRRKRPSNDNKAASRNVSAPVLRARPYPSRMLLRTLLVALLGAGLAAQDVRGRVLGFDGKPAGGVPLNLFDEHDEFLFDVDTHADGSFVFHGAARGVKVRAWLEGVVLSLPAAAHGVDFDFKSSRYFTVSGHVVDPLGAPLAELELSCRDADDYHLAAVTTDARGAFSVRMNQKVDHLLVDPACWRHRVPGPFAADAAVAVDLRLEKQFFRLQGTLRDENGAAVAGAEVTARNHSENIATTRTAADGHWTLWCNRQVVMLWYHAGLVEHRQPGLWPAAATVDLDWRAAGFVVLTGRVLDAAGKPVRGANLIPLPSHETNYHLPDLIATTDAEGRFRALVPSGTKVVVAFVADKPVFGDGPWKADATIEMRAPK